MADLEEGYVQVAADGSGKKIRNVQAQILQPDGTTITAYMQVIALADENGNPILFQDQYDFNLKLLREIRAIRLCMQELYEQGQPPQALENFYEKAVDLEDEAETG